MKKDLERVLKTQIEPIVEHATKKYIGITIKELARDITDKLGTGPFLEFAVDTSLGFKKAKRIFKKYYLDKLLRTYYGDVTTVARIAGVDRRTVHRFIKEFGLKVRTYRKTSFKPEYVKQKSLTFNIKNILEEYRDVIKEEKLEKLYKKAPHLSRMILSELTLEFTTMQDAEEMFEKRFLAKALKENNWKLKRTAKKIGLRYETLHRKVNRLGLKAEQTEIL